MKKILIFLLLLTIFVHQTSANVGVTTRSAWPEILNVPRFTEDIYPGTEAELIIRVKNNGDSGTMTFIPELGEGSIGSVLLWDSQSKYIENGQIENIKFEFRGNAVGSGKIRIYINAGSNQIYEDIPFTVKEVQKPPSSPSSSSSTPFLNIFSSLTIIILFILVNKKYNLIKKH